MSVENPILSAPEEPVGNADDMKSAVTEEQPAEAQTPEPQNDPQTDEVAQQSAVTETTEDAAESQNPQTDAAVTAEPAEGEAADAELADELAGKSREELVSSFAEWLNEKPVQQLRDTAEAVKVAFYKLHRTVVDAARKAFVENGGAEEDFAAEADPLELRLKELFKEYRRRRDEYNSRIEAEKESNLKAKLQIIEDLKELTGSDETMNTTFARFRELQQRWKETGPVPQEKVKDVWENYNLQIDNFYSIIKINKELRDLDWKRNLVRKTELCEQAEALITEPSIVEAFHKLQKLHEEWRETGPVAPDYKDDIWKRFQAASGRINKEHQKYFENIKQEQENNLRLKTELCEKTEELSSQTFASRSEWNKASDSLLEIQKVWKTIGFAPKKDNNRIYERFRAACDKFFETKRNFYAEVKNEMDANLEQKRALCEQAEVLSESSDWKRATDELIALQAKWKTVGGVARRHSDEVWKRFRAACDKFFARKAEHFSSQDGEQEENLRLKSELLDEMAAADVAAGGHDMIKEFQRRWSAIGFVPIARKEEIQQRYKAVLDEMFGTLRGSERDRSMNRFKAKVSAMKSAGDRRIHSERDRLYNRVRQLEQDIALLENNIGFFSKSKNAESMIAGVREKIEKSKQEMRDAVEKIKLIDKENEA